VSKPKGRWPDPRLNLPRVIAVLPRLNKAPFGEIEAAVQEIADVVKIDNGRTEAARALLEPFLLMKLLPLHEKFIALSQRKRMQ
jgi:hypothetical protein